MKKIGLVIKEASEKRIKENLKDASGVFVIMYSGVSSPDMSGLRQSLKLAKADLFVVKNSVARIALKSSGLETLLPVVQGPCGLVFTKEEAADISKVLYNFAKEHNNLKLEGGCLKDKIISGKDIETMAKLPGKDMLRAQVAGALKSPINGLVFVLSGTLKKLVICLDQIKQKKT